jgi:hypothetical protein
MKKIFEDLKIYYSGSIQGTPEMDREFPKKLVKFMEENGANVLSNHVALGDQKKANELLSQQIGIDLESISLEEKGKIIRHQDIAWVDEATHVVALVNSPSHGVGVEIQRALDKEKMGMNKTPILCLIKNDLKDKLSLMISGVEREESDVFYLRSYKDLAEAQKHIFDFLGKNRI